MYIYYVYIYLICFSISQVEYKVSVVFNENTIINNKYTTIDIFEYVL